jgi:hypothetical protein
MPVIQAMLAVVRLCRAETAHLRYRRWARVFGNKVQHPDRRMAQTVAQ